MMEVICKLHALTTLPSGKEPMATTGQEAGWAPEVARTLWRRNNSLSLLTIEPKSDHSLVTTLTELSRLHKTERQTANVYAVTILITIIDVTTSMSSNLRNSWIASHNSHNLFLASYI
jgi:hypothetical protein